ncbi:hypothetical protein TNCV_3454981 [Trichonephila clavipes]|nr:hypothetical protein TNCV_3454981 [Trichonephila clavipes]
MRPIVKGGRESDIRQGQRDVSLEPLRSCCTFPEVEAAEKAHPRSGRTEKGTLFERANGECSNTHQGKDGKKKQRKVLQCLNNLFIKATKRNENERRHQTIAKYSVVASFAPDFVPLTSSCPQPLNSFCRAVSPFPFLTASDKPPLSFPPQEMRGWTGIFPVSLRKMPSSCPPFSRLFPAIG